MDVPIDPARIDMIRERYQTLATSPQAWAQKAEDMHYAAEVVWTPFFDAMPDIMTLDVPELFKRYPRFPQVLNSYNSALFLMALALENLLKAVLCALEKKEFNPTGYGHSLESMLVRCHELQFFSASTPAVLVSKELTTVLTWYGRYPAPTRRWIQKWKPMIFKVGERYAIQPPGRLNFEAYPVASGLYKGVKERARERQLWHG